MQLPIDEEHDKQMMRVPKPLEMRPLPLLERKEDHHTQSDPHDPAGGARAGRKVGEEESDYFFAGGGVLEGEDELGKVDHVGDGVDCGADDDSPGGGLVEGDVFVEWDDVVEWGAAQHGDEIPADRQQDKDDVDVEDEGGGSGDGCCGE